MNIAELLNSQEFIDKLNTAQSLEEAAALFEAEGLRFSEEELKTYLRSSKDELCESDLENINGGVRILIYALSRLLQPIMPVSPWLYR